MYELSKVLLSDKNLCVNPVLVMGLYCPEVLHYRG